MIYLSEALSLLSIFIVILAEIRVIKILDYFVETISHSFKLMVAFVVIFDVAVVGLAHSQRAIYGDFSL